jgi:hypothetical protein
MTLLLVGCATVAPVREAASRISVVFVEPEKFTDARRAELEPTSSAILDELEKFLIVNAERYVGEDMRLNIRITDVDLAGDFELFRGLRFDRVRITKGLYPPHVVVEFQLVDAAARVVQEGKRDLTDIDYQLRSAYPKEDYLRYEKDLLRDWLRDEFSALKSGKVN